VWEKEDEFKEWLHKNKKDKFKNDLIISLSFFDNRKTFINLIHYRKYVFFIAKQCVAGKSEISKHANCKKHKQLIILKTK